MSQQNLATRSIEQRMDVPSTTGEIWRVMKCLDTQLRSRQIPEEAIFAISLSTEEALVNAMKHGNHLDPEKTVSVKFEIKEDAIQVMITDQGAGFDPSAVPDPRAGCNIEQPNGRGLMLMNYYMDQVSFSNNGRTVTMTRSINLQS